MTIKNLGLHLQKQSRTFAFPFQKNPRKLMYAIVNIAGQQTKVEANKFVYAHKLAGNVGDTVTLGNALLTDDNGTITIGAPELNVAVTGTILAHVKGDKVLVFKKKRRKGYQKMNGHRQSFTKVMINSIG
jgi:large subunit ribosomal protein L21